MENIIEVRNLVKKFGDLTAVNIDSLKIRRGELFGLLGPNGSGKTTTVKLLTGQIRPTKGDAKVLGISILKDPIKIRELVGIIPEQENPPSFLTAEEYLYFVAKIRKLDNIRKKCEEWFKFLEFEDQRDVLCKDLSRGTRQKLMFAQAFIHEPTLAFIDEPLINLDPIIQRKVKDYLMEFVKKGGTIFFSTHVLEIAEEICTTIGIIDKGKIIYKGPIKELKKRRQHLEQFFIKLVKES
ncbi:MAG: ABC transporter ATP-binding protein [Candidatus Parvarchaeota archaeon]|nr:ABC transporter ATP-binding protein [Candidatus Jingweiarchaeum tengchongense]MCW1298169.1 ABC transporter ATP-binding protein [Candidatus Jingweiarchaeum tengchongense]MCW1299967.1 ABC transporter ATP-binding protein [Candidatus Jingweiarchaeum tengchongense]MCW1305048.1 ABC transporter ATP-binding protein [Candidatus Jingweiarchaeum tengchongense]MCW1305589.1 ABC transporter ATP-binding protein [Candidatus Jingweiarchaeum tengchongense]